MKTQDEPVLDDALVDPAHTGQALEQQLSWVNRLAGNVRHFRRLHSLSQEDLAERCGIYRTYLSRIETGKCNPSLTVLVALARALEIQPHTLLAPLDEA